MGSFKKKIRDNHDKEELIIKKGIKPKHRCPYCHRFSLFLKQGKEATCYWCNNKGRL